MLDKVDGNEEAKEPFKYLLIVIQGVLQSQIFQALTTIHLHIQLYQQTTHH